MVKARRNPWPGIGLNAWALGVEAWSVIGLRTLRIAAGGAAATAEARKMVQEKIQAGLALQLMALTGGLGTAPAKAARKTLAHYKTKVSANRRRLSR